MSGVAIWPPPPAAPCKKIATPQEAGGVMDRFCDNAMMPVF